MSVTISGKLVGPNGDPRSDVNIMLTAVNTSSAVVKKAPSVSTTDGDGNYSLVVEIGTYDVMIEAYGRPFEKVGQIKVYGDSKPGTLNDYLTSPGADELTPDIVAMVDGMRSASASYALQAKVSRDEAKVYADTAEAKADTETTFDDKESGLAATENGKYFRVPQGVDAYDSFIYYKNDNGTAVPSASWAGKGLIDYLLPQHEMSSSMVAVAQDLDGNVPLWLRNGMLGAIGIESELVSWIFSNSSEFTSVASRTEDVQDQASVKYALVKDTEGKVPVWLDGGLLDAVGVGPRLLKFLIDNLDIPDPVVPDTATPLVSDGASLMRWRIKKSLLDIGQEADMKVGFTGDSWTEWIVNPQALRNILLSKYNKAGDGYLQLGIDTGGPDAGIGHQMDGVTMTKSGWQLYDASVDKTVSPPYGCGADGMAIYTSGTAASISYTILATSTITINYWDTSGKFRYRTDGGSYVTVTCGNTLLPRSVVISLTPGTHTIDIDTVGNNGIVSITGLFSRNSNNGLTLSKLGNGGITAEQYAQVLPYISGTAKALDLDLLIMIMGTNDAQILGITQSSFEKAMDNWVGAWKAASPSTGIILIIPAPADIINYNIPITDIRDSIIRVAKKYDAEWLDYHGYVGTSWSYNNISGIYYDGLHMNSAGGHNLANLIYNKFLA